MTYKFYDRKDARRSVEFMANENLDFWVITENEDESETAIQLNEKDLFNLIGGLLRLQSEMKNFREGREVKNG